MNVTVAWIDAEDPREILTNPTRHEVRAQDYTGPLPQKGDMMDVMDADASKVVRVEVTDITIRFPSGDVMISAEPTL